MLTSLANFIQRRHLDSAAQKGTRYFRLRLTKSVTYKNLSGELTGGTIGDEIIVDEATAGMVAHVASTLGEVKRDGTPVVTDHAAEIPLPAPPVAPRPTPFGDRSHFDQAWTESERVRVLRERVSRLSAFMARIGPTPDAARFNDPVVARARSRGEKALELARADLQAYEIDRLLAAQFESGRQVVEEYDRCIEAELKLQQLARELFGLRVAALGLTPFGVDLLYRNAKLRWDNTLEGCPMPARRLGFVDGQQVDYGDDSLEALWGLLQTYKARLAEIRRREKKLVNDLEKARAVLP